MPEGVCLWRLATHHGQRPPVRVQYATDTPGLPESTITAPMVYQGAVLGVLSPQD